MFLEYVFGPKCGARDHQSREVGAALIAGGIAVEIAEAPDPIRNPRARQRGYSYVRIADGRGEVKLWIRFDDGMGGYQLLDREPAKVRTYVPPVGDEPDGHYEWRCPLVIPEGVLEEFHRLGGGPRDRDQEQARAEAARDRLQRQQYESEQQAKKANIYLNTIKAQL